MGTYRNVVGRWHTVCVGDPFETFFGVIEGFTEALKTGQFVYVVVVKLWEN